MDRLLKERRSRLARPEDIPHGTPSGYFHWGCRCDECKRAAATSDRRRRNDTSD